MPKHPRSSARRGQIDYAPKPLEFTVTNEDVKGSVVADTENCAAACALKHDPHIEAAWVTRTRTVIQFADDHPDKKLAGKMLRYQNPAAMKNAVVGYDVTAGTFPPGTYRLGRVSLSQQAPHPYRKTGERGPSYKRKRPSYALR